MDQGYTLQIARTPQEIDRIREYSDTVFKEDGVAATGIQQTDLMPNTRIFYATTTRLDRDTRDICGTIRYTLDSEHGLPFDHAVFVDAHTPDQDKEAWHPIDNTEQKLDISVLRDHKPHDPGLVNFGMLAIDTHHRVTARLYEVLLKLCVAHSMKHGAQKAIITVNHAIERTMLKFGFKRFYPKRLYSTEIKNYIVVMWADLTQDFFSRIDVTLPDHVAIFSGSEIFRIFPRNALICKQGDPDDKKVYLVVSGSVRIEVETDTQRKRIALIGPGEIFGEMALIDHKPRSADVISNHRHVILQELTHINENIISQTPEIFFEFASMLSRRIRALNEKVKKSTSFNPEKYVSMPLPNTLLNHIRQKESLQFYQSELICRQGDQSKGMYIINKGRIAISIELPNGDDLLLGFAQEGSLVGEMALIEDEVRSATMTACEIVHAVEIKKEELTRLIQSDWKVGHFMLQTIVRKLRISDRLIAASLMIRDNIETQFKQALLSIEEQHDLLSALNDSFGGLEPDEEIVYDLNWVSESLGVTASAIAPWVDQLKNIRAVDVDCQTGKISVIDIDKLNREKLLYDLTV